MRVMRWLVVGGTLVLATACSRADADSIDLARPRVLTVRRAPGDSVQIIYRWTLPTVTDNRGPITGVHSTTTRTSPSPVIAVSRLNLDPAKPQDTVMVPTDGLALGATANGTVCLRSVRRTLVSSERCAPWSATFLDQTPPAPDTVIVQPGTQVIGLVVKPDSASVASGATRRYCAFAQLEDGKWYGTYGMDGSNTTQFSQCTNGYATWFPITERTPFLMLAVWESPIPAARNPLRMVQGRWSWDATAVRRS